MMEVVANQVEEVRLHDQWDRSAVMSVQRVNGLSSESFHRDFVNRGRPVVISGLMSQWRALHKWDEDYFNSIPGNVKINAKVGDVSRGELKPYLLGDYVKMITDHEAQINNGLTPPNPPYLHDVPLFHLVPALRKDIEPFPLHLFPKWYWNNFQNYIQFFMGYTGSLTPLHFDTLCTHNLFFQVAGRKRFILIEPEAKNLCYMEGWRWSKFNPSAPDFNKFPKAVGLKPMVAELGPGDTLYIPSGMLHQVHGLSYSISFNIDWHTKKSALTGMLSFLKGAPAMNGIYNSLIFSGLMGIPSKYIFPHYKSYLNYVS